uniref:Protein transport protein SEC23 n=1 Tax=Dermatophagoides pteronyssinus TaxID=6956 RepID=A0A6P6YLE1_DERPT|nr:protein transport protein sec23-1-like [Dermatophagoides pteronyssinus]
MNRNLLEDIDQNSSLVNYKNTSSPSAISCSWGLWPPTKADAAEIEVPVCILYQPFNLEQELSVVRYEPIRTKSGNVVLNTNCTVDFRNKTWTDPITSTCNMFPPKYADQISETCLPTELISPTIDYLLPSPGLMSISYCFIIDIAIYQEELEQVKDAFLQMIGLLPPNANISIITYGSCINIYELVQANSIRSFAFRGNSDVTLQSLQQQLGLYSTHGNSEQDTRFMAKISNTEDVIVSIIESIESEMWPVCSDKRTVRCTGTAIATGIALMETLCPDTPCRIQLFVGGVSTAGVGAVAPLELAIPIRQHQHLNRNSNEKKLYKRNCAYYESLAMRAQNAGHAIDLYCCALDQTGLAEMKVLAEKTGGICLMTDTFSLSVFRDTLKEVVKTLGTHRAEAYNVKIEVQCTKEVRIAGAIGCLSSLNNNSSLASDTSVGEGKTNEWALGVMHPSSTVAFYFDINNNTAMTVRNKSAILHFKCFYTNPAGERRLRVHNVSYKFGDGALIQLGTSFDQQTATVAIARLAVHRMQTETTLDTFRWLDRKLIRVSSLFGDYQKGIPSSFRLPMEFMYYPTFMYHLRRGPFIDVLNNSPDETAFYRLCLLRENLRNTITMVTPSLIMYTLNESLPQPVVLDSSSLKNDCVLLMDSYFHVVLWHGQSIVRWKAHGYHEKPEYANLKTLLEAPVEDALMLLKSKLPCPKFINCGAGGSQERFLLAKVNPSIKTHSSQDIDSNEPGAIMTEEVNVNAFIEHLSELAKSSNTSTSDGNTL